MVKDRIDIKALNMEELAGVVDLYPWYAGARLELCRRMSALGDGSWGEDRYVEAALFVRNRRAVYDIMHSGSASSISDSQVHDLVASYLAAEKVEVPRKEEKKVRRAAVGGDYFSEEDYSKVRNAPEAKGIKARPDKDAPAVPVSTGEVSMDDFCTETLAEIYLEQGYPEEARRIYSKLMLFYPEKSAYFASLIEKLK
ncbi:MAG: hypothetical protein IKP46_00680 [Bacteroidales bacterium]|nr:hypothetical protein [Bacteroidales bacterium]